MPYAAKHTYVTAVWKHSIGTAAERGQFGFRTSYSGALGQGVADTFGGMISNFWGTAGAHIPAFYQLESVKVAPIGPDGLYPPGEISYEDLFSPVVNGGGGSVVRYPFQVAHVATLRTAVPRGPASHGRIYLPPMDTALDNGGWFALSDCLARVQALKALFDVVNASGFGDVIVASKVGAGRSEPVTHLSIGNRADVQRRRADQIIETYQDVNLA